MLYQSVVSRSKALAIAMVPLFGSILKALVASVLLSIEYLEEKIHRNSPFRTEGCFLGIEDVAILQGN